MQLRNYQHELIDDVQQSWATGNRNVLAVAPTGSGKSAIMTNIMSSVSGSALAVAHRTELVAQISLALSRWGVRHRLIAPSSTIKFIIEEHYRELGKSFYDPAAKHGVGSVDTIISRGEKKLGNWRLQVAMWAQDEGHHILRENKWGKIAELFPNAWGLGVTATPVRADGKGLGRHHDGVFDDLIVGPTMRQLIDEGFLTDYRIFMPPSDIDEASLKIGSTGDYTLASLKAAAEKSHIVGDVVEHYKRIAGGKLGVTFATDVATAMRVAEEYNAAGVPAACVSAKTPDRIRAEMIRRFRNRDILQLVNVDLFGEGFDLPAVEVVSMARPTESYGLYVQQFGRGCRPMEGKTHAIIIDHVGNVMRHGLPDAPRAWSLDRRDRKSRSKRDNIMQVTACTGCMMVYEAYRVECPYCGEHPKPVSRSAPEFVKGNLQELDPKVLARLRGEISRIDGAPRIPTDATPIVTAAIKKNHRERQKAQDQLRLTMAYWAGAKEAAGLSLGQCYQLFYIRFGMDVMTAQTLGAKDAISLEEKVRNDITSALV